MNTDLSVTPTRKSRSREKTKRPDTLDTSEDRGGLLNSGMNLDFPTVHSDGTSLFTQTFPDTAVTFKSNLTPARAKKPKPDLNLGVKPLESTVQKSLTYKPIHDNSKFPRVTATITRPVSTSVMSWDSTAQHTDTPQLDMGGKFQRDANHNLPVHMDQYGNIVQVQALVNQGAPQQDAIQQGQEPTFTQPIQDFSQPPNMDLLRANPVIQRLVEKLCPYWRPG